MWATSLSDLWREEGGNSDLPATQVLLAVLKTMEIRMRGRDLSRRGEDDAGRSLGSFVLRRPHIC